MRLKTLLATGAVLFSLNAMAAPFTLTSGEFQNGGVLPLSAGGGGKCPEVTFPHR